jgi:chemotaxis-related protein WspD
MTDSAPTLLARASVVIDDCWNRIGIRGDGSCERLENYLHCRNCPVHEAAAAALLDRPLPAGTLAPAIDYAHAPSRTARDERHGTESVLVFRLGDEWLALPTPVFRQVAVTRPIHRLPHRTRSIVLGVVNIEGALLVCVSLAGMLGIEPASTDDAKRRAVHRRMLVVEDPHGPVVFPVDEVEGVQRYAIDAREPVPSTVSGRAAAHARSLIRMGERTVGLLDVAALFGSLDRSLG